MRIPESNIVRNDQTIADKINFFIRRLQIPGSPEEIRASLSSVMSPEELEDPKVDLFIQNAISERRTYSHDIIRGNLTVLLAPHRPHEQQEAEHVAGTITDMSTYLESCGKEVSDIFHENTKQFRGWKSNETVDMELYQKMFDKQSNPNAEIAQLQYSLSESIVWIKNLFHWVAFEICEQKKLHLDNYFSRNPYEAGKSWDDRDPIINKETQRLLNNCMAPIVDKISKIHDRDQITLDFLTECIQQIRGALPKEVCFSCSPKHGGVQVDFDRVLTYLEGKNK